MIGRVIESKSSGTRLNYAVPADLLAKFVAGEQQQPAVATSRTGTKADLGIRLFALGGRRAPAYIDRVLPGGPAAASPAGHAVRTAMIVASIVAMSRSSLADTEKASAAATEIVRPERRTRARASNRSPTAGARKFALNSTVRTSVGDGNPHMAA